MQLLPASEIMRLVEESDLFQEFFQLPDAQRYREALQGARAWALDRGESLPEPHQRRGAYAIISGRASLYGDPAAAEASAAGAEDAEGAAEGTTPPRAPRIFNQWSGLRGQYLEEALIAAEACAIMEFDRPLLDLLLGRGVASQFKSEFFGPLLSVLAPIADTPPDVLGKVVRSSRFTAHTHGSLIVRKGDFGRSMFFILAGAAAAVLPGGERAPIPAGHFFGEIAILINAPRTADVVADGDCLVMECDRDAITDLRKKSKTFKALMDQSYRERAMLSQLQEVSFLKGLDLEALKAIRDVATLESFEPYEPVFFQGSVGDALYIVLNGTMTVVEETPNGTVPLAWSGDGQVVGALALMTDISGTDQRRQTVTALQRVDTIRLPMESLRKMFMRHPSIREGLEQLAGQQFRGSTSNITDVRRAAAVGWMLETQHLAGTAVLAVDMDDCIRCNNCVTACQSVHADGLTRFFWSTMRQDEDVMPHVRLSNSCQHCEVALCMQVCPTNALERELKGGAVFIDYDKCIRCGKCGDPSQGCPYGSIDIVPADSVVTRPHQPFLTRLISLWKKPAAEAPVNTKSGKNYPVKCDLCHGLPYQACVHHCPTGAVFRLDGMGQFSHALANPQPADHDANRPAADLVRRYVHVEFPAPLVAGKPGELEVAVREQPPGLPIHLRMPERGVYQVKLNFFLHAPETLRIGGGGPLRQMALPVDNPRGVATYAMTHRTAGPLEMELCVYHGGLYLGHQKVVAEFGKAPAPARPEPGAKAAPAKAAPARAAPAKAAPARPAKET